MIASFDSFGDVGKPEENNVSHGSSTSGKSFTLPEEGDFILGPRVSVGDIYGAGVGVMLVGEYKLVKQFGVGGLIGYSSYSQPLIFGTNTGWNYSNFLVMAQGAFHLNEWIRVKNMDLYGNVMLGYNFANASWYGHGIYGTSPGVGGLAGGFGANVRYFLTKNFAVSGGLGYGIGILNAGVDYRF